MTNISFQKFKAAEEGLKILKFIRPPKKFEHPFLKIVQSQANIRNMFLNQKSPLHPKVGVLQWHRQTDEHGDSMNDATLRPESVKRGIKLDIYGALLRCCQNKPFVAIQDLALASDCFPLANHTF